MPIAVLARMNVSSFENGASEDMRGDDADEQYPACPAVRAEFPQTIGLACYDDLLRLPQELEEHGDERDAIGPAETRALAGDRPERDRGGVEYEQERPRRRAERERRGFDPDQQIVLLVLMRVDRVVAQGPSD